MAPPQTQYVVRPDGVSIAFQVLGEGPLDLVLVPGLISHLDFQWTDPGFAAFLRRLASFSRLIMFDKVGTGCSDPVAYLPSLEERASDIALVMDAAGSRRAAILAFSEGGPGAVLLAATQPDRVSSLVLYGTFAVVFQAMSDDELASLDITRERVDAEFDMFREAIAHWGEGRLAAMAAPSIQGELSRRGYGLFERASASPGMARAMVESVMSTDVRAALPLITQPTLVLHRTGDRIIPVEAGRLLADRLPDARFEELPGDDHAFWFGDFDPIVDEIEQFLTGERRRAESERALATVMFTDIVGSTELAARLGDREWRRLLERHDEISRAEIEAAGGRVVKQTGDGLLATFDGPARAVRCTARLVEQLHEEGIDIRAGVHTGECEIRGDDLGGLAVHIGARVSAQARRGEVLVSSTVRDLVVGSELRFSPRGEHDLKGVPGSWTLYALGEGAELPVLEPQGSTLSRGDRTALRFLRRAPGAARLGAELTQRHRAHPQG